MVTEQYVSFETAKLLNKHGFDINTDTSYVVDNTNRPAVKVGDFLHNMPRNEKHLIAAPTQALVLRWLREKHNIHIEVHYLPESDDYSYVINNVSNGGIMCVNGFDSYENAVEAAIIECLTNLL